MQVSFKEKKPTLFIVSTPIGNLSDMTFRAVETLKTVDVILAEDTRHSIKLLKHFNIDRPLISYHDFSDEYKEQQIIDMLLMGKNLALISDAGTPGISDPGYGIIIKAIEHGFHVVSIPGTSAVLAALVTSGLVMQPFTFLGFLPRKQNERDTLLKIYKQRSETLVIYESPLRIEKTINHLYEAFGNRNIALCRELTKTFETIIRTDLRSALDIEHHTKGEYVIVVSGATPPNYDDLDLSTHVTLLIHEGFDEKEAMKEVARLHHISKSEVYKAYKIDKT